MRLIRRLKPFCEDELPTLIEGQALIAHPGAALITSTFGPITLAIGPEGGFVPFEIAMFERAGFRSVSLGPRILRCETAVAFALVPFFDTWVKTIQATNA